MLEWLRIGFLGAGGAALAAAGLWFAVDHQRHLEASERAPGVVVALASQRVRGATLYKPVVRFRPADSVEPIEFTAKPGLWPSPYEVGDEVIVAYRPDDPDAAKVVGFWMLWFMPIVCVLFGGACGFAAWHSYRHRAR